MGRGRAKAKQTRVARELKYSSPNTDLSALQKELTGSTPSYTAPERVISDWLDNIGDMTVYADEDAAVDAFVLFARAPAAAGDASAVRDRTADGTFLLSHALDAMVARTRDAHLEARRDELMLAKSNVRYDTARANVAM